MFARTDRLLLRPRWAEDAPALAKAISDEKIARNLPSAPWPFRLCDAEAHLAAPRDPFLPSLLIFERTDGEPVLVGACRLARRLSGSVEFGYWIACPHWGRGFATEAGLALIAIARALGLTRLEASHFLDNPAFGRVLEKLGFQATSMIAPRLSCARDTEIPARYFGLNWPPGPKWMSWWQRDSYNRDANSTVVSPWGGSNVLMSVMGRNCRPATSGRIGGKRAQLSIFQYKRVLIRSMFTFRRNTGNSAAAAGVLLQG